MAYKPTTRGRWQAMPQNAAVLPTPIAPPPPSLLKRMESLEDELSSSLNYTGNARWMIPYADLLSVLMGLLLVLVALTPIDDSLGNALIDSQTEVNLKTSPPKPQENLADSNQPSPDLKAIESQLAQLSSSQPPSSTEPSKTTPPLGVGNADSMVVTYQERGLVISLPDQILFSSGHADLTPSSRQTLDQLAHVLKTVKAPIRVEGHTDNTPIATAEYPSNWELSTARATQIVRYFVEAHHFNPQQLAAAGYGEYKPLSSNSSIQGKQKNRRVDIVVLNHQAAQQEPG